MNPVKVVLSNGEGDELDLGTFNQGVVFECLTEVGVILVEDVASGFAVAAINPHKGIWCDCRLPMFDYRYYKQIFVQPISDQMVPRLCADMENIEQRGES